MKKVCLALALAGGLFVPQISHAQFADAVISYTSGSGFAAAYTNASAALGAPASGSSVTPFAPPFSTSQLVSIGAGGEITLHLDTPILNNPSAPFGINFIVFANSFFIKSGSGTVNGLFYHTASTVVQVSNDDSTWFTLNPSLAPPAGELFPTDGSGNPRIPVNPALALSDFNGQNLTGIRSLYNGSAGGTGYQLAWAQDANGNSVDLASADYIRVEVQSGVLDLDAVSAVPEPSVIAIGLTGVVLLLLARRQQVALPVELLVSKFTRSSPEGFRGTLRSAVSISANPRSNQSMNYKRTVTLLLLTASAFRTDAASLTEDFSTDPASHGWRVYGDTNLFQWNATNQNLAVTWDSSQSNSYFYHPLGTILAREDGFSVDFDLQINSAQATNSFELAVGLLNFADATQPSFSRDTGDAPNIFEFDYFPDGGFGPSIDATMADGTVNSTNMSDFYFAYDTVPLDFQTTYHITLTHVAGEPSISGMVLANGQIYTSLPNLYAGPITDFRLDTFSVSSYAANGGFGDSLLASGTVDNIVVSLPQPPVQNLAGAFSNGLWQTQFTGRTNWLYTLARTTDFQSWKDVTHSVAGVEGTLVLSDTNAPASGAFYRVRAARP